jgi:hypothetical protein
MGAFSAPISFLTLTRKERRRLERKIPTFAADGRRLRAYSLAAIEHLLSLSKVVVRRDERGRITVAQFRGLGGMNPLRQTAHAGTRYSFLVRCGDHKAWEHKDLLSSRDVELLFDLSKSSHEEELRSRDRAVRAVFLAVPLSCLVPDNSQTKSSTYICDVSLTIERTTAAGELRELHARSDSKKRQ